MNGRWPRGWRVGVALALLATGAALTDALREGLRRLEDGDAERALSYARRFEGAREALPRGVRVGYLTEGTPEAARDQTRVIFFNTAQCAVAPALLVNTTDAEWLLGNFHSPAALERALRTGRYTVAHNARNGVVVLRRIGP